MSRRGFKAKEQSPFRFATLSANKNEVYRVNAISSPSATALSLAASARFIACAVGKGGLTLVPTEYKEFVRSDKPPVLHVAGSITDFSFSPHDDCLIGAVGGGALKTFSVPAGGLTEDVSTPDAEVKGLGTVLCMKWHPAAANIVAVGAKNNLFIVDTAVGEIKYQFEHKGFGNEIVSVAWNADGSQLAAVNKKGKVSVGDVRTAGADFLTGGADVSADLRQPQHAIFFINQSAENKLCVIGLDKSRKPTVVIFSAADTTGEKVCHKLNFSSGLLLPLYCPDSDILYLTVRSSSTTNYYDVSENKLGTPKFQELGSSSLHQGAKGMCFMGKRAVDTDACEINRMFVLSGSGIIPHSIKVPRKIKGFAPELYRPALDAKAAQDAAAWLAGGNQAPCKVNMATPWANTAWKQGAVAASEAEAEVATETTESATPGESDSVSGGKTSEVRAELDKKFAVSHFKHLTPNEPNSFDKKNYWFDARPGKNMQLGNNISGNDKWFVMPWKAIGGSGLMVQPLDGKKGRFTKVNLVRGHREQVSAYSLNQYDEDLLISGNAEGRVVCQRIPDGGLTAHFSEVEKTISVPGKITRLFWHPWVKDVFVVGITRPGDTPLIQFYDYVTEEARKEIEFFEDAIMDITLHPNCRLMAVSSKDGKVRVIDLVTNSVLKTFTCAEIKRDCQVRFVSDTQLLTIGFGARSSRSMTLWDFSGDGEPKELTKHSFLTSNAILLPHYDPDSRCLLIGHFGLQSIDVFQIHHQAPYIELLQNCKTWSDVRGMHFLHKTVVDVRKVEILRSVRVSKDGIIPISWTLPRRRKEFFQDDLYVDTLPKTPQFASADDFFDWDGEPLPMKKVSLKPDDMELLSLAPAEALTERQLRYKKNFKVMETPDDAEEKAAEARDRLMEDADEYTSAGNRWDAKPSSDNEVDDDEWGSDLSD